MTWLFNNGRKVLILLALGHFVAGLALSVLMHQRAKDGILQHTDETRYVPMARGLAQDWRNGNFTSYASVKSGDPHPGYYYVLATMDYVGISHPLAWRLVNICIAFAAILLWWCALKKNKEKDSVRNLYLALLLLCPSMLFMSSWIIREAWLYMFSGLVAVSIASLARPSGLGNQWKSFGWLFVALTLIGFFRGYEALIIGLVVIAFISSRQGWKKALLVLSGTAVIGILLNYQSIAQYIYVIAGLDLSYMSLLDLKYAHYEHTVQFYEEFLNANRFGNSVIDPSVGWFHKVWLFFSFPLPWQAQSALQKLAVPEILVFLMLLPGMIYGMYFKVMRRDAFAIFVLVWFLLMAIFYISVNVNLGTMYRHKASLMFMMLYFAAVGATEFYEKYKSRYQAKRLA